MKVSIVTLIHTAMFSARAMSDGSAARVTAHAS